MESYKTVIRETGSPKQESAYVQVARCPKCKLVVGVAMIPLDDEEIKKFATLMRQGCSVHAELFTEKKYQWCQGLCDRKIDSNQTKIQL